MNVVSIKSEQTLNIKGKTNTMTSYMHPLTLVVGFAPVFSDAATERKGNIRFIKIDTESEQSLATKFQIRSIPTIMVFKNGQRVDMINGALPKSQFDQWLNQAILK